MAKLLEMPKLSPTMEEGQIASWSKKEGDAVAVDDLLAEVETDKATMEFRSFDKGTLLKILAPAGSMVKLGQPVAIVGNPGEDVSALLASAGGAGDRKQETATGDRTPETGTGDRTPETGAGDRTPETGAGDRTPGPAAEPSVGADGRVKASPYVRKLARERGLELAGVSGSGPNGRIVARDVEGLEPGARGTSDRRRGTAARAADRPRAEPERRPLSMMRKTIARRLTESKQTVPHFYLSIDVDADALHDLRERVNADLAALGERAPIAKISFNDLVVKACALALVQVPECNAQFTPDAILIHERVDVSVAVAVEDGLVTPVVRDADRKSVAQLAAEVRDLAARAKNKKLRPDEMTGGTFSVSNLGMYGIDDFAAVINPPEGAILAVGQVRREPVVRGDAVVPGRRLGMTLSCDHRVVDGAVGATFLRALRALLEHPSTLLVA
jgi:pyruvate dehydrogenase E2 component (dihydrolipoamide acetyltransferase)